MVTPKSRRYGRFVRLAAVGLLLLAGSGGSVAIAGDSVLLNGESVSHVDGSIPGGGASNPDLSTAAHGDAETTASKSAAASPAGFAAVDDDAEPTGRIVSVLPNPLREGDGGESVVVRLPEAGNWSVSDGERTVDLVGLRGYVLLASSPPSERGESVGRTPLVPPNATVVDSSLSLSNGGERLTLRRDGVVVDDLGYGPAPEDERYLAAIASWRPVGYLPRAAVSTGPANATAFVLPDAPGVPLATIAAARERILLAGYTFSSSRVADALLAAARRNVTVRVLVEAHPVGGVSRRQARILDRLVAGGVDVRVVGEPPARFAFHHPKYAVVDDRALVLTENWKPSGTGGRSNRGWGVRVAAADVAAELAAVFEHDVAGPDTRRWRRFRRGRRFETGHAANGSFESNFQPRSVTARNVTVLTAPGNAESAIVARIDDADSRVEVLQPTLGTKSNALLRATLRAARRGVEVRILLSGAWYVAEENARLVEWLNDWAERNDAPLAARLAEPNGRYEKVHAKGLLVDDEVAVVGSLNWNRNSARENREVALALRSRVAVEYYRSVFEADWRGGGGSRVPVFAAGAAAAVVLAGLVARRTLSFASVKEP